jgi:predicted DNA-binding protein
MIYKPVTKITNVRLPDEMHNRLENISSASQLSVSDIIRLCIRRQLPNMERGRFKLFVGRN